jgi:Lon protease-like protein
VALTDSYRTLGDLPAHIPVFPLRGAILLPRSELPLNVFEPRYLAMIDAALKGDRMIGIIQPGDTIEAMESPEGKSVPLKRIGCAGRLTAFQELPDGRMRIALTGIARFAVQSELSTITPFRIVAPDFTEFAADLAEDESTEQIDRQELMRVLKGYFAARKLEVDWTSMTRAPLEPLVNGLAAMSPFRPEEKQALLEAMTLKERARVLMALAEMATAAGDASGGAGTLQ